MEIERINTYQDARFSRSVLRQHGCFLADGIPCEVEIISDSEAVIRGARPEAYEPVIESFRFYTPHITCFYDENHAIVREYPKAELLTLGLDQIQPSQFYVDEEKIHAVSSFIHRPDDIIIQVLRQEAKSLGHTPEEGKAGQDRYISLDGHTRLYYAVMQGWDHVRAVAETSDDWVYRFVEEAKRRNVRAPKDLVLLNHEEYEEKWDGFCDRLFAEAEGEQEEGKTCDC